jgi:hypothetical protein
MSVFIIIFLIALLVCSSSKSFNFNSNYKCFRKMLLQAKMPFDDSIDYAAMNDKERHSIILKNIAIEFNSSGELITIINRR